MTESSTRNDQPLLERIQGKLPELEAVLAEASSHWGYEDPIYRYYHQSFKVYHLQSTTKHIVEALSGLAPPGTELNAWFLEIVAAGTGKSFTSEVNRKWTAETRPIVEAFFHAKYFLEMVCKYGRELQEAPRALPSGWAAVLYLYNMR